MHWVNLIGQLAKQDFAVLMSRSRSGKVHVRIRHKGEGEEGGGGLGREKDELARAVRAARENTARVWVRARTIMRVLARVSSEPPRGREVIF